MPEPTVRPVETFGHEPVTINEGRCGNWSCCSGYMEAVNCIRCGVPWPCASAVVLGLTTRREDQS